MCDRWSSTCLSGRRRRVTRSRRGEVDALVNNAGFGHLQAFPETDHSVLLAMLGLNVTALTLLAGWSSRHDRAGLAAGS